MTHNPYHPAGAGAVKPLEWREETGEFYWSAASVLGRYHVTHYAGMNPGGFKLEYGHGLTNYFDTFDEAKAAAQADYEARILSALSPNPVPNPEAEGEAVPIMWQWRSRLKGGTRDAWERGRFNQEVPPFAEVEERALYTRPYSEAEIADLRVKLERAREAGMRDMLNAILALNPEVAAKVARWREPPSPPNPEGKIPFEVALWVTEVATQLGIKSLEELEDEALSLAGEEKTGDSDV